MMEIFTFNKNKWHPNYGSFLFVLRFIYIYFIIFALHQTLGQDP